MIDLEKMNKTILNTFKEKDVITLSRGGLDYRVDGIFTAGSSSFNDDPTRNNTQPEIGIFTLEVLTSDISGVGFDKNDKATVNGKTYKIIDTPFDDNGMTTIRLRK